MGKHEKSLDRIRVILDIRSYLFWIQKTTKPATDFADCTDKKNMKIIGSNPRYPRDP
jgi:hypothetical protein